ncbi:hypothetical protein [Sellimonas intestinalis]
MRTNKNERRKPTVHRVCTNGFTSLVCSLTMKANQDKIKEIKKNEAEE